MARPVERSIWAKGHRAISNYRRYRFGLLGLISVVLMSRTKVTAYTVTFDASQMWDTKTMPERSNCKQWACVQCVSGMARPVERSIWPKGYRAISNYRRYRFGVLGLISVVLMSRTKVTAYTVTFDASQMWDTKTMPERSNCKQWACAQCVSGNGSSCRALNMT